MSPQARNFCAATVSLRAGTHLPRIGLGGNSTSTLGATPCPCRPFAPAPAADRRPADRTHPARSSGRLRGARAALPAPAPCLLPPHARLPRGRRGRPPRGLRRLLQGAPRRRSPRQRASLALPDRAQPLPQPPAPAAGYRAGLDGRLRARRWSDHRRHRSQPRGVPPDRRRRPGAARDPAHRAAPARDRRSLLRPDRRGDGHDGAERQVAARPRAGGARGGSRGAAAHLRRGAPRARPGRGRHRQELSARYAGT